MALETQAYKADNDSKQYPFFLQLSAVQVQSILINSSIGTFGSREIIFHQNSRTAHIMFVKSGLVKVYKPTRSGRSILLKIVPGGNFLGLTTVLTDEVYRYSAAAVDNTEILFIENHIFKEILRENYNFTLNIIKLISEEALYTFERLQQQTHKQLPGRIADVLLYFCEEIYKKETFTLPLTRRELAEFAGTTKESFIRTLTEFKHDKIIELDGSRVTIKSMKIVKTLSNIG